MGTKIDHYCLSSVDNLEADIDEIKFSDNLRIVRLDLISDKRATIILGEEILNMANLIATDGPLEKGYRIVNYRSGITHSTLIRAAELSNYALEWHFAGEVNDPFNDNYNRDLPIKLFSDVITSLRLLKDGLVGRFTASNIIDGDPSGLNGPWSKGENLYYQPSSMNMHDKYVLTKTDVDNIIGIFQKVSDCNTLQLLIALSRFNRLYAREDDIERLIDIMVAFEALYLKDINTELKFRLASRTAIHLGEDSDQKKQIFNCLCDAYQLRSEVVHGNILEFRTHKLFHKDRWKTPYSLLEQLASLLRRAIHSILFDVGEKRFVQDFHLILDDALISQQEFLDLFNNS